MDRIKIKSYSLAVLILHELTKHGIRENSFSFDATFLPSELAQIKKLTITNCDSLEGIEELSNLTDLTILGVNLNSFQANINNQNHISNYSYINRLPSLKTLNIAYDNTIKELDISQLNRLTSIRLFCNHNLGKITGLDSIKTLQHIIVCGCPVRDIGDIKQYIENTRDAATNILDIHMFARLFKEATMRSYLKNKMYSNLTNLSFGEHIYFGDEMYVMNVYQIIDMYNRALGVLRELHLEEMDDAQKVYSVYDYIIKHLQYDYKGLEYRDKNYAHFEYMNGDEKQYFMRRLAAINSSFGAITRRKAVCDGYVNLMHFLLNICDIPSETVICSKDQKLHSAIKFQIDGVYYYADPEQDQKHAPYNYFKLSYEEFTAIYDLAPKEQIDYQTKKRVIKYGTHSN